MNTDNTKVNINLLKENEALKERIEELKEVLKMAKSHISIFTINGKENPELNQLIENALNSKT